MNLFYVVVGQHNAAPPPLPEVSGWDTADTGSSPSGTELIFGTSDELNT